MKGDTTSVSPQDRPTVTGDDAILAASAEEILARLRPQVADPRLESLARKEVLKHLSPLFETARGAMAIATEIVRLDTSIDTHRRARHALALHWTNRDTDTAGGENVATLRSVTPASGQTVPIQDRDSAAPNGSSAGYWSAFRDKSIELARLGQERESALERRRLAIRRVLRASFREVEQEVAHFVLRAQENNRKFRDFFGISAGLWDLENGEWHSINWKVFETAEAFVKRFPEIRDLANRIGRATAGRAAHPAPVPEPKPEPEKRGGSVETVVEILGRSGIEGYTQGRSLDVLPPVELALLADGEAETLFLKQYAEGSLTNLDYVKSVEHPTLADERVEPVAPPERGPVILCIDTSGSMTGIAEEAARALVVPVVKTCIAEGRGVYLIAFSTEIKTLDLSRPESALAELAGFLDMSFRGGTDLRPALAESLSLLSQSAWREADLLIVSDFRVPKIMIKRSKLIDAIRREKSARIHALSITAEEPTDDLHIFDSRWHFRIDARGNPAGIADSQFREAGI